MVKVEVTQGKGLKRELKILIPAETVQTEMDKKYEEIRREADLKGFRKGKAPMNMIKSLYAGQVRADVVDELIKDTFPKAIMQEKLKVASPPSVTDLDLSDEGELSYTATIEVLPDIDTVGYDGLELETIEVDADDKEVDEVVEALQKDHSELRKLDRPAEDTDVVVADLHKTADSKEAFPGTDFPESQIDLANPLTVKEFKEQLVGVKAGDKKAVTVTYPDDYGDKKFAGATVTYDAEIKSVNERIMPEINDAFARQLGRGETALELRMSVRDDIKKQKAENLERIHKRDVMRQMCEKNPVEIPESLIEDYLDNVVEDFKSRSDEVGEQDEDEIRRKYRPVGIESMRWDLIWRTLARQEKIEVSPEDTEKWIKGFADYNQIPVEKAQEMLNASGKVEQLRDSLLEGKVLEFLIDKAKKVTMKDTGKGIEE
ncbi:trigger factor [candidate division GN15 bacterium]|nr:trigger factor [candidate division GN15 bacterium]